MVGAVGAVGEFIDQRTAQAALECWRRLNAIDKKVIILL